MQKIEQVLNTPVVDTDNDLPGTASLFMWDKASGIRICEILDYLLVQANNLTRMDREYLAAAVSHENYTEFDRQLHSTVLYMLNGHTAYTPSHKVKALEEIARFVATGTMGSRMNPHLIDNAKELGATPQDLKTTILIAALFCMLNRYTMFMNTPLPEDDNWYVKTAEIIAEQGYKL